jgi:hypothetical protein
MYPAAFRDEYSAEMRAVLRRRWRDEAGVRGTAGMALFSLSVGWDALWTACEEHTLMLLQDLNFAFRTLARSPLFATAAILTIGLGIGANTAIFSVVDHILLRPLPFPESDRLLVVRLPHPTEHDVSLSRNPPRKSLIPFETRGGFLILVTGRRGLFMLKSAPHRGPGHDIVDELTTQGSSGGCSAARRSRFSRSVSIAPIR